MKIARQVGAFSYCLAIAYTMEGFRLILPLEINQYVHLFGVILLMNVGLIFVLQMIYEIVSVKSNYKFKFSPSVFYVYPVAFLIYALGEIFFLTPPSYYAEDGWVYPGSNYVLLVNGVLNLFMYVSAIYMLYIGYRTTRSKTFKYFFKLSLAFVIVGATIIILWINGILSVSYFIPKTNGLFLNLMIVSFFTYLIVKLDFIPSLANRYAHLMESSLTPIIYINENKVVIDINDAAKRNFNFEVGEPLLKTALFNRSEKKMNNFFNALKRTDFVQGYELKYWDEELSERVVLIDAAKIYKGVDKSYYLMISDVTIKREQESIQKYLAYHDSLTGVYNRAYFEPFVITSLESKPKHRNDAFIITDLNDFKLTNDKYGHHIGDAVLKECALLLKKAFPPYHTLARLGGDEFVIFIENIENQAVFYNYCKAVQKQYSNYEFEYEGMQLTISISLGVVFTNDHDNDYLSLYKACDQEMYSFKEEFKQRRKIKSTKKSVKS